MKRDILKRLSWPSTAGAGTAREVVGDEAGHQAGTAIVMVHNPSGDTALTVRGLIRWTDTGGVVRDAELDSFAVPIGATKAYRMDGLGMGTPVIRITNDAAVVTAFDAELRVEMLGN